MIPKFAALGLAAILVASCTPMPKQAPLPPEPAAVPEEPAAPPVATAPEPPMAPTDVRAMSCATLSSAQDDDKAYASTFLLGYRSALMRTHTIDIKRIEAVEEAALADCATKPTAKASQVFHAALLRIGPGGEPRKAHHHRRHRPAPAEGAAGGPSTPEQPAPEPAAAPSQSPPMQYAPAASTPLPAGPAAPQPPAPPADKPLTTRPAEPQPSAPPADRPLATAPAEPRSSSPPAENSSAARPAETQPSAPPAENPRQ